MEERGGIMGETKFSFEDLGLRFEGKRCKNIYFHLKNLMFVSLL